MKLPIEKVIDSTLDKYGLPEWVRPYVYRYARANPVSAVRFAISLVDVKRKKGEVTKKYVKLPNGTTFSTDLILRILNLFFYGEESMAEMSDSWSKNTLDHNQEYERRFAEMAETDIKRTRAIKNLAEGLGHSVGDKPDSIAKAFEGMSMISDWNDRVIATGIMLRYSYFATFGMVFYRVFYPVSPEFMRSFGKVFEGSGGSGRWDTIEAERLIRSGAVSKERVLALARQVLPIVLWSIESNMGIAREMKLEKEVHLLSEISIAYPFQCLRELGLDIDVDSEMKNIRKIALSGIRIQ